MTTCNGSAGSGGEGNSKSSPPTKPLAKGRPNAAKHWCGTLNNWTEAEYGSMVSIFSDGRASAWCIGKEHAPTTGTPHLQIAISFHEKSRPGEITKNPRTHWKIANSPAESLRYCMKEGDYVGYHLPRSLQLIEPDRDWEITIIDAISKPPDNRTVYWVWSDIGDVGKSQFCRYLAAKHHALFFDEGRKCDIMLTIKENDMDASSLVTIDIPRAKGDEVCYKSIESIKNGIIFSPKYESGHKIFPFQHVLVFANRPPRAGQMSHDRYRIMKLDHMGELVINPQFERLAPVNGI